MLISHYQKEFCTLNMFPKNKQAKANKEGRDKRGKSFKLCDHNKIWFLFPCLFYFSSDKLA